MARPATTTTGAPARVPVEIRLPEGALQPGGRTKVFQSTLRYDPKRIHAAAMYCSDGRVGEHFDDFLQNSLALPRYDRVALPGGPACLAGHTEAHVEEQGVMQELGFLVEVHGLSRLVLIAHAGCAFYSRRLHLPESYLEAQQKIDLVKAAIAVRRMTKLEKIEAYFARPTGSAVQFEPVELA